jgi:hypothetical protein
MEKPSRSLDFVLWPIASDAAARLDQFRSGDLQEAAAGVTCLRTEPVLLKQGNRSGFVPFFPKYDFELRLKLTVAFAETPAELGCSQDGEGFEGT